MAVWTEENPLKIFVTVGTNHNNFKRMLDMVDECLTFLEMPYILNVQYGTSTPYVLKEGQKGQSKSMYPREETQKLVADADLVFSHCGIGSIYNALVENKPTIIIPRLHKFSEFSDDHQLQIAKEIKQNPMILMLDEQVNKQEFLAFFEEKVPQPKMEVDLKNPELAHFIKSRLLDDIQGENKDVLTIVSAGGHMTQALCIMPHIERFHLVTSLNTGLDVGAASYHFIEDTQFSAWVHFKNFFSALNIIRKVKPAALFSTGGPICLPFALAAKLLGKKFIYLDTLSRVEDLSNTARFLNKHNLASEIYVQWEHHTKKYPKLSYHGKTFDICGENLK
ncbi:MAG TPA: hypothetical protein DHW71_02150 [Gammaproteobacteria bacterium]|mgnify:FL=1|nr:hypothetical protein [Gammaproteobacteria bacterium]MEC8012414.1 glycosyltransferase [Pseudomonadota bacterium]HBF07770.1 hypothetical protein [Gammaproteobacteria bacterium]HCK91756.1 hypothetical protein [Gammaproteobacteria bacterium]|tara:strand:+ start:219 stop:1226 length:1008 start_codon:yes stop_codon:yes gene_type:complete